MKNYLVSHIKPYCSPLSAFSKPSLSPLNKQGVEMNITKTINYLEYRKEAYYTWLYDLAWTKRLQKS